jgi:hypothetical protein
MEESWRQNVEWALLKLATDADFVRSVREDPESALPSYGFALKPAEMEFVKNYLGQNEDLTDEQIVENLQQPQPMWR